MPDDVKLGGVFITLRARTAAYVRDLTSADRALKRHQQQVRANARAWRNAKREARELGRQATSIRNLGAVGAAAAAGLTLLVRSQSRHADELRTNARLTGRSIAELQTWTQALASARSDEDSVADGLRELNLRIREAIDGNLDVAHAARLAGLRLTDEAGAARDAYEVIRDLADIIPTLTEGEAVSILDRLGGEDLQLLYSILSQGSEELERRLAAARRTARQLTDEQADALVELGEGLDRVEIAAKAALGAAVAAEADRLDAVLARVEDRLPDLIDGFLSLSERGVGAFEVLIDHGRELLALLVGIKAGLAGGKLAKAATFLGPKGRLIAGAVTAPVAGYAAYEATLQALASTAPGVPDDRGAAAQARALAEQDARFRRTGGYSTTVTASRLPADGADPNATGLLYTADQAAAALEAGRATGREYVAGLVEGIERRRQDLEVALGRAVAVPEELRGIDARAAALTANLADVRRQIGGLAEDTDEAIKRKAELVLQEKALVEELGAVAGARDRVAEALRVEAGLTDALAQQQEEAAARDLERRIQRADAYARFEEAERRQAAALERDRDLVRQVGFAFTDTFGAAIRGADSLSDRLAMLADQLAALALQRLVFEPLVNSLAETLVPGGSRAGGGNVFHFSPTITGGAGAGDVADGLAAGYGAFQQDVLQDLARPSRISGAI